VLKDPAKSLQGLFFCPLSVNRLLPITEKSIPRWIGENSFRKLIFYGGICFVFYMMVKWCEFFSRSLLFLYQLCFWVNIMLCCALRVNCNRWQYDIRLVCLAVRFLCNSSSWYHIDIILPYCSV